MKCFNYLIDLFIPKSVSRVFFFLLQIEHTSPTTRIYLTISESKPPTPRNWNRPFPPFFSFPVKIWSPSTAKFFPFSSFLSRDLVSLKPSKSRWIFFVSYSFFFNNVYIFFSSFTSSVVLLSRVPDQNKPNSVSNFICNYINI